MNQQILSTKKIKTIYNKWAVMYDASLRSFYLLGFQIKAYRKAAVKSLNLAPGDTVVDLGCGTGLNFGLLQKQVGPQGSIIGVDLSDGMLQQAQNRIKRIGWHNVNLVQADMAECSFLHKTDGILSTLALTMSPGYDQIIQRAADVLQTGQRMSIFELQKPERWPDRLVRSFIALLKPYGGRVDHMERTPCLSMEEYFSKSNTQAYYFGAAHVTIGTV